MFQTSGFKMKYRIHNRYVAALVLFAFFAAPIAHHVLHDHDDYSDGAVCIICTSVTDVQSPNFSGLASSLNPDDMWLSLSLEESLPSSDHSAGIHSRAPPSTLPFV